MKTNGSPLVSVFSIVAKTGRKLTLTTLTVSAVFLSSCAQQGGQQHLKSAGHVATVDKVSKGQLCYQFVPLYLDVPPGGKKSELTVWLRADSKSGEKVKSEERSFDVLASGPSNLSKSFAFKQTPPSTGSYPLWWSTKQTIEIPGNGPGTKRYFFSTDNAKVQFTDSSILVTATLCSERPPTEKRAHARKRIH